MAQETTKKVAETVSEVGLSCSLGGAAVAWPGWGAP